MQRGGRPRLPRDASRGPGRTRAFEGCENVETYTDADDPDRIVLWEKWATREDQEAYLAWRTETGTSISSMTAPMMAEPPRFVHLEPQD